MAFVVVSSSPSCILGKPELPYRLIQIEKERKKERWMIMSENLALSIIAELLVKCPNGHTSLNTYAGRDE